MKHFFMGETFECPPVRRLVLANCFMIASGNPVFIGDIDPTPHIEMEDYKAFYGRPLDIRELSLLYFLKGKFPGFQLSRFSGNLSVDFESNKVHFIIDYLGMWVLLLHEGNPVEFSFTRTIMRKDNPARRRPVLVLSSDRGLTIQ